MSVHVEEPDLPNGAGHAEQAPLIGQQRVRLLACATCLLLVGWQAPGSSVGSFGREGRVLMHLENSPNSALGSSGQPGRMLRQSSAGDSTQRAVEIAEASSLESVLGHTEDAGQHWTRQVLGGEEQLQRTLGGHHKLPKWVRWVPDTTLSHVLHYLESIAKCGCWAVACRSSCCTALFMHRECAACSTLSLTMQWPLVTIIMHRQHDMVANAIQCPTRQHVSKFWFCRLLGVVLGWASSVFYLGSRVSQICKNISRRSAEGLSLAMFGCAICANITYGLGILLRTYSWHYLRASLPWILGSLGTVALDLCIFCQARSPTFSNCK